VGRREFSKGGSRRDFGDSSTNKIMEFTGREKKGEKREKKKNSRWVEIVTFWLDKFLSVCFHWQISFYGEKEEYIVWTNYGGNNFLGYQVCVHKCIF